MNIEKKDIPVFILCGKARSGKDTVAEYIKKFYEEKNKKIVVLAYAFYIKEYAKKITSWDGTDDTKPRDLLNIIGTDIIRKNIDDLFFVKRMIEDINVYQYLCDGIVISDARFPIEINMIKQKYKNVYAINVIRPDFNSELSSEQKNHIVEMSLNNFDSYDFEIVNDGSLDELKKKVYKQLEELE